MPSVIYLFPIEHSHLFRLLIPEQNKIPANSKSPAVLPLVPGGKSPGNKAVLQDIGGIGKVQVKNMSRGQYFKANSKRIISRSILVI